MTKIGIILGSTRPGRNGEAVAKWVYDLASKRDDAEFELVDLLDFKLPHLDEAVPPSMGQYANEHTRTWAATIAKFDGFIFVTPEYNHSFSPALKNAYDYLNNEWWRKPLGYVSYGGVSGGTRGVVALDQAVTPIMVKVGANVEINFAKLQVVDGVFTPNEKEAALIEKELGELIELSEVLKPSRLKG